MSTLSLKINDLMTLNNIDSITELAKYIKITQAELRHFLSSKAKNPDKNILKKLAHFFEMSVDELIQDNRVDSIYISEKDRHHGDASSVLRYLMQDIGSISEGELFRRTGVPQPTIHRILSGATPNPRMDSIKPLAEFFNVTPDQMLGRVPLPKDRISGTFLTINEMKKMVPVLNWEEIINWPNILKNLDFKMNREWVTSDSGIKGEAFALKIISTDYLPEFRNGTVIIIDPKRVPKQGDFAIGVLKKNHISVLGQVVIENNNSSSLMPLTGSNCKLYIGQHIDLIGIISEAKHHFK